MPQLENLNVDWVSFVDRAAVRDPQNKSEPRRFLIWKREGTNERSGSMPPVDQESQEDLEKVDQEKADLKEALEKAEAELKQAQEELEKGTGEPTDSSDSDGDNKGPSKKAKPVKSGMAKADLPEEWQERIEKMEVDQKLDRERAEKAEELAKAERDQRLEQQFIAKAETYRALPVKADTFGPILKRASETLTESDYAALESLLKAADEQITRGELFKEAGRGSEGHLIASDAFDELQRKAEELRKSDPKMSAGEAMRQAMKDDPELQARYLHENR